MNSSLQSQITTIGQATKAWLHFCEKSRKKNTVSCYADAFRRAFAADPMLESMDYLTLSHRYFQKLIYSLESKYAKSTLNHIRAAFSNIYKSAVKNGDCDHNPIAGIDLPRGAATKKVTGLTKKQEYSLMAYLPQEKYRNMIAFFLHTGMRFGELTNLKWNDYDQKNKIIRVQESKTNAGIRHIPLIPEALFILAHQQFITNGKGYIFQKAKGGQITVSVLRRTVERIRKNPGLQNFTIHQLRHTFASRLVEKKCDYKALSALMGHTNVAFTIQCYPTVEVDFLRQEIMLLSQVKK